MGRFHGTGGPSREDENRESRFSVYLVQPYLIFFSVDGCARSGRK